MFFILCQFNKQFWWIIPWPKEQKKWKWGYLKKRGYLDIWAKDVWAQYILKCRYMRHVVHTPPPDCHQMSYNHMLCDQMLGDQILHEEISWIHVHYVGL